MSVIIDKSGDSLLIKFDYSPERIAKIKTICGYWWNASEKVWTVPHTDGNLKALKELYKNENIEQYYFLYIQRDYELVK